MKNGALHKYILAAWDITQKFLPKGATFVDTEQHDLPSSTFYDAQVWPATSMDCWDLTKRIRKAKLE